MPDAVTVVLPVHNAADRLRPCLAAWFAYLGTLGRESAVVVVDDGSTDGTAAALADLTTTYPTLTVLTHPHHRGYGASLRTALPTVATPLLCYTDADPTYRPRDFALLLKRLEEPCDVYGTMKVPDAASGCRAGRPVPTFWKAVGRLYRGFHRLALGNPIDPLPGWLGLKEHLRGWLVWVVMAVPLVDVNSRFKVVRKAVFDKFPIQSDSDFVHAEIFAKMTFVSCLVAEEPLSPATEPVVASWWGDFWTAFSDARFTPQLPDVRAKASEPAAQPASEPAVSPAGEPTAPLVPSPLEGEGSGGG